MKKKCAVFIVVSFLVACLLLVTGSDLLFVQLPGEIPAGNVISAICFILPAVGVHWLMQDVARFKTLRKAVVAGALLWLPVSVALAGNTKLIFTRDSFQAWAMFSVALGVLLLFVMLHSVVFFGRRQKTFE